MITIIILLILAGISINAILGESGIIAYARWSEYVTEYETVDEAKNLYITEQTIDKYGKNKEKFTIKSLFTSTSYAANEEAAKKETIYPVDLNQELLVTDAVDTLKQTICYIEGLELSDLYNEEKVKLYKVNFSILNGVKVHREYVINIKSGMLYSIQGHEFKRKIYHTPREGIVKDETENPETPEDPKEGNLKIHYLSGYDNTEYTQEIPETTENITLKSVEFKRENYKFVYWKDVTNEQSYENVIQKGGYYNTINGLIDILGEEWESDIIDIIENNEDYIPEEGDDEEPSSVEEKTKSEILEYIEEYKEEIQKTLGSGMSIDGLVEFMMSNTEYIKELMEYEQVIDSEDIEESTEENENENMTYEDQSEIEINDEDLYLEAVWGEEITLNANGGKIEEKESKTIGAVEGEIYGTALDIEAVRSGYIFAGWYTKEDIQKTSEDKYNSLELTDKTLYAKWEEENTEKIVKITYNANGGNCSVTNTSKVKGTKIGTMPQATRTNYLFVGWYTQSYGGEKVTANTTITADITVYAHWTTEITMYYDLQGGQWRNNSKYIKMNPAYKKVYIGQNINFKMPSTKKGKIVTRSIKNRKGNKFEGWYTEPKGKGQVIKKGTTINQETNFTIYAYWNQMRAITYDANGGLINKKTGTTQKVKYQYETKKYPKVARPKREGYIFLGWYDSKEGGNKIELANTSYTVSGDITLYAHWEKIDFTINVSNVTSTGWTQNVAATSGDLSGSTIKYRISTIGPNSSATTVKTNTVTNKKDMTKYYVWAIATKLGESVKSSNYIEINTGHTHTGNTSSGGGCYGGKNYSTCYYRYYVNSKVKSGPGDFRCLLCGSYHDNLYYLYARNINLTCTANHFSYSNYPWTSNNGIGIRWGEKDSISTGVWYTSSVKHSTYVSSYYMNCGLEEKESDFTSIDFGKN